MKTFSYFAYGSNMLPSRLQVRCPSARLIGVATVPGYVLAFRKKSVDASAKATIVAGERSDVLFGSVFQIAESELAALDRFEDCPNGYDRETAFQVIFEDTKEAHETMTYIATEQALVDNLVPYDWYKVLVLAGAYEHGFPQSYLSGLESAFCQPDPLPDRSQRLEALDVLGKAGWELAATPPHIRRRSAS